MRAPSRTRTSLALASVALLGLAACGGDDDDADADADDLGIEDLVGVTFREAFTADGTGGDLDSSTATT